MNNIQNTGIENLFENEYNSVNSILRLISNSETTNTSVLNLEEIFNILYDNSLETFTDYYNDVLNKPINVINDEQFKKFKKGHNKEVCAICIETNNECIILPCNHTFHEECIKIWLTTKSATCPYCKFDCNTK